MSHFNNKDRYTKTPQKTTRPCVPTPSRGTHLLTMAHGVLFVDATLLGVSFWKSKPIGWVFQTFYSKTAEERMVCGQKQGVLGCQVLDVPAKPIQRKAVNSFRGAVGVVVQELVVGASGARLQQPLMKHKVPEVVVAFFAFQEVGVGGGGEGLVLFLAMGIGPCDKMAQRCPLVSRTNRKRVRTPF